MALQIEEKITFICNSLATKAQRHKERVWIISLYQKEKNL